MHRPRPSPVALVRDLIFSGLRRIVRTRLITEASLVIVKMLVLRSDVTVSRYDSYLVLFFFAGRSGNTCLVLNNLFGKNCCHFGFVSCITRFRG